MPTNVVMPQMGESIAEGTIVRWIKKVGDSVDRDEPLFEISTDKVDAEIPSPAAGVLTEIKVKEGETVPVNSVVAVIGGCRRGGRRDRDAIGGNGRPAPSLHAAAGRRSARRAAAGGRSGPLGGASERRGRSGRGRGHDGHARSCGVRSRRRSCAGSRKEHNVDISPINGTGISGRVTKKRHPRLHRDRAPAAAHAGAAAASARSAISGVQAGRERPDRADERHAQEDRRAHGAQRAHLAARLLGVRGRLRRASRRCARRRRRSTRRAGAKLTFTAFIAKVIVDALRQFPIVNASIDGDNIVYKKDINLGIAVALDQGLIVPVIRNADEKNLLGLSRAIKDLAARARSKKLNPDEVQGGTFTITNPGIFGALYGLPLINQPQVAILGVGAIEKRAVVVDDAIAIRPMCHLTLGYDHRLIDGADAGRFLSFIKERLEGFDEGWM